MTVKIFCDIFSLFLVDSMQACVDSQWNLENFQMAAAVAVLLQGSALSQYMTRYLWELVTKT